MSSWFFIVRYKINKLKAAAADRRQWGRVINETIVNKRKIIYINGGIYNDRAYLTFTWHGKLVFVFAFVRGACLRCLPRPSPVYRLQGMSRGGRCGVVVWVVHRRSDRRTDVTDNYYHYCWPKFNNRFTIFRRNISITRLLNYR